MSGDLQRIRDTVQFWTLETARVEGRFGGGFMKGMAISVADQDALLKFLETLQVLPPGTKALVVDEKYQPKVWPPAPSRAQP